MAHAFTTRCGAQSPLNHVGDGPLAVAMKDTTQTGRHAHFEDGSGDGYDSSAAAHRHAMEYDEVTAVTQFCARGHTCLSAELRKCLR